MKTTWRLLLQKKNFVIACVPLIAAAISSIFPLRPLIQQALIGVVLVWMQLTFLFLFAR